MPYADNTYYRVDDSIGIMLGNDDLKLRLEDSIEQPFNFKIANESTLGTSKLATYVPGIRKDGGKVNIHRCGNCGQDLFMTERIPAMGGDHINVNITALDLSGTGTTLKNLTDPKDLTYVNGANDSWQTRVGEPYSDGCW